jgi:hypothetical protein
MIRLRTACYGGQARLCAQRYGGQARALLVSFALASTAQAQTRANLSALNFLLGDWDAIELPAGESGAFNFSLAVQDRIIVRTNYAKYPARDGKPATRHDDLMVIFMEGNAVKADYFDSEQHVIHYLVQPSGPNEVVFVSEPRAGEPRYRLSYTLVANGRLKGTFESASSEAPDHFKPLLAWTARKLK